MDLAEVPKNWSHLVMKLILNGFFRKNKIQILAGRLSNRNLLTDAIKRLREKFDFFDNLIGKYLN